MRDLSSPASVTALSLGSIPSHINTYERLAVWAIQSLHNTTNSLTVNVAQGTQQQPVASCALGRTADGLDRFILSAYIPVDMPELNSGAEKTWMAAKELAQALPHVNLTTN